MKRLILTALALALAGPAHADTLVDNVNGITLDKDGKVVRFTGMVIGTDGKVKQVELVSTDSPGFFEATKRRALSKWRFKPATRGGVAEESWKEMRVRFEIKNA